MLVLFKNKTYELDMPYRLFESLKKIRSTIAVKLQESTKSSYKAIISVPLTEVEDYSVSRNLQALLN